jgi:Fe-S cluster assembly iron-binding protein IscA
MQRLFPFTFTPAALNRLMMVSEKIDANTFILNVNKHKLDCNSVSFNLLIIGNHVPINTKLINIFDIPDTIPQLKLVTDERAVKLANGLKIDFDEKKLNFTFEQSQSQQNN